MTKWSTQLLPSAARFSGGLVFWSSRAQKGTLRRLLTYIGGDMFFLFSGLTTAITLCVLIILSNYRIICAKMSSTVNNHCATMIFFSSTAILWSIHCYPPQVSPLPWDILGNMRCFGQLEWFLADVFGVSPIDSPPAPDAVRWCDDFGKACSSESSLKEIKHGNVWDTTNKIM